MGDYRDTATVCAPWVTPADLCCTDSPDQVDCNDDPVLPPIYSFTDEEYILAASNYLFNRSCRKYPGLCEVEVMPCDYKRQWRNKCICYAGDTITLPGDYPVHEIIEVSVAGVVVDPGLYRLDRHRDLVRLDCGCWPSCQALGVACNHCADTLIVTYTTGLEPPIELQIAAADLACEMRKACSGSDAACGLPPHVTNLTRRGVSITLEDITSLMAGGKTGIQSVDYALDIHGNCPDAPTRFFDPARYARGIDV